MAAIQIQRRIPLASAGDREALAGPRFVSTRSGKSHMIIVTPSIFEKLRFQISVHTKTKSRRVYKYPSSLKSVFEIRFRNGLGWTVRLTVEVKLGFQIVFSHNVDAVLSYKVINCASL